MNIKNRIKEIVIQREKLLKEMKSLQDECEHPEYYIGMWSWRLGQSEPSRICADCGCFLGSSKLGLEDPRFTFKVHKNT